MPVLTRAWVITAAWEPTAHVQSRPLQSVPHTARVSFPDFSSACRFGAQQPSLTPRVCYRIPAAHLPHHASCTYASLPSILCCDSVLQPPSPDYSRLLKKNAVLCLVFVPGLPFVVSYRLSQDAATPSVISGKCSPTSSELCTVPPHSRRM